VIKLLYIHGLKSRPKEEKIAILEEFADTVFAPQINYFGDTPVFSSLLHECKTQNINALVGSSAGGLMAFWLNKYLGVKALLFNPALKSPSFQADVIEPNPQELQSNYFNYILIGKQDQIVLPESTLAYLQENESSQNYQVEMLPELGHRINLETFRYGLEQWIK